MKTETQEKKHKINTQDKHSQIEFLPVRRNKLPYNIPDWNETPADTEENADIIWIFSRRDQ